MQNQFEPLGSTREGPGDSRNTITSEFDYSNVLNQPGGSLAGGLVLGDPDNDGESEIVVVGGGGDAGRVTVLDYNSTSAKWDIPTIWIDSQALMDVVVADLDPHENGEELVVGGYSNNVTILYWPGGTESPRTHKIGSLPYQIFGLGAGNINTSHEGLELAAVDGKTNNLTIYQSTDTPDQWDKFVISFDEKLRNVHIGEYDSAHNGEEIIALGLNNTVFSVMLDEDHRWQIDPIWQDTGNLLDCAIGDADHRYDGNEVIVVGFSQNATMLRKDPVDGWINTTLWTAPGGLEGIDIGEFDPSHDHNEVAIGGYSRTVVMLTLQDNTWVPNEIYKDPETSQQELNGVVIGEFYSGHKGNEIMVVAASGVTTMLEYVYPDFTLSSKSTEREIIAGDDAVFTIEIGRVSSFSGFVNLEVNSQLEYELSETNLEVPGTSSLTVQTSNTTDTGSYKVNVTASDGNTSKTLELTVIVHQVDYPDFLLHLSTDLLEFERLPDSDSDGAGKSKEQSTQTLSVSIEAVRGFSGTVKLNLSGLPEYFESVISNVEIKPGEKSQINIKLISNPPEDENTYKFTITAQSGDILHYDVVDINLSPSTIDSGEDAEDKESAWLSQVRIGMIVGIIILVLLIIIAIINKYKRHDEPEE